MAGKAKAKSCMRSYPNCINPPANHSLNFSLCLYTNKPNMYTVEDIQARAKQQKIDLDVELSKYKIFRDLEAHTKVSKVYVFLGGLAILLVLIIFNIAGELVTDAIAWIYPGMFSTMIV